MSITPDEFQFKRGLSVNLPKEGLEGEPLYTLDTKKLYIGNGAGKPLTLINANIASSGGSSSGGTTTSGGPTTMEMPADEKIRAGEPCVFTATGVKPASVYYQLYVNKAESEILTCTSPDNNDPAVNATIGIARLQDYNSIFLYTPTGTTANAGGTMISFKEFMGPYLSKKGIYGAFESPETARYYDADGAAMSRMTRTTVNTGKFAFYVSMYNVASETVFSGTHLFLTNPSYSIVKDTYNYITGQYYGAIKIKGYETLLTVYKATQNAWTLQLVDFDRNTPNSAPPAMTLRPDVVVLPAEFNDFDVQAVFKTNIKGVCLLHLRNSITNKDRFASVYFDGTTLSVKGYADMPLFQAGALSDNVEQRMFECEDGSYMIFAAGKLLNETVISSHLINVNINPSDYTVSIMGTTKIGDSAYLTSTNIGNPMRIFFRPSGIVLCYQGGHGSNTGFRFTTTIIDIFNKKPVISRNPYSGGVCEREFYPLATTTGSNSAYTYNSHDLPTFVDKSGTVYYSHLATYGNGTTTFYCPRFIELLSKCKILDNTDLVVYALADANPGDTVKVLVPSYTVS